MFYEYGPRLCVDCVFQLPATRMPGCCPRREMPTSRLATCSTRWSRILDYCFIITAILCIKRTLEMMYGASISVGKHATSNFACACSQRYTKDSVIWLAQMTLCVVMLCKFPPFVEPDVILDGLTNRLSICYLLAYLVRQSYTDKYIFPIFFLYTNFINCDFKL